MGGLSLRGWGLDSVRYGWRERVVAGLLCVLYAAMGFSSIALIDVIRVIDIIHHRPIPFYNPHTALGALYAVVVLAGFAAIGWLRVANGIGNIHLIALSIGVFLGTLPGCVVEFMTQVYFSRVFARRTGGDGAVYLRAWLGDIWPLFLVSLAILMAALAVRWRCRGNRLSVRRDTSGNLGSARMATARDIRRYRLRAPSGGLIGKDGRGYIRSEKLTDRLIMAYRGGGKTSSLLIPGIIDHLDVNKLITDIKGELCAVTVRRALAARRRVYVIDPFHVLASMGLGEVETCGVNPLSQIRSGDPLLRDRQVSALAAALHAGGFAAKSEADEHFGENARIIIEGLIDFYLDEFQGRPEMLNLVKFHDWWLEAGGKELFERMRKKDSSAKAMAAGVQLLSAGDNEAGSMKTTVYRQLHWLRSDNIRRVFSREGLNPDTFVSDPCDIYVVLPEDMVRPHSRLVRVIMGLIKVRLIQSPVARLRREYCFMLDELGQFGYSEDVEQVINTLRSRGVRVWASFQTVGQVNAYPDRSVFREMPVKHFLGSDDLETLDWIQKLGGKTTALTEQVSRNVSPGGGTGGRSRSDSRGVSEAMVDLIQMNEIREMPDNEQYVFIRGKCTIRCRKAYYFNESAYRGKFDPNPLEDGR